MSDTPERIMTERGFEIFGEVEDLRGYTVRIQESSHVGAMEAWIFIVTHDGRCHPSPMIRPEQAKQLIDALQKYIDTANDPSHWRNQAEYREQWP